jgi:hypothetical protein
VSDDHIDLSAISNLDVDGVRMQFRIKDASFYTKNPDTGEESHVFVDSPWSDVPIFRPGMMCAECNSRLGSNGNRCDSCADSLDGETCPHGTVVCPDCIDSWSSDYYFIVGLVRNGTVDEWFALNGAPGYKAL